VRGEVEKDGSVLVLKRVHVTYKLTVDPSARETVERVHEMHADRCPVARSIGGSVGITTSIDYE
jgi:uncharacterized OsmC-like protein